jgi:DNA-directed RNA polymerase
VPVTIGASATAESASDAQAEGASVIERQRALEDHMLGLGGERFRKGVSRAMEKQEESSTGAGVKLLRHAVDPVEKGIRALLDASGGRGRPHIALKLLKDVDPAAAAFITARIIIDSIHAITPLRTVATDIASTLMDERRYRRLEEKRPALFRYRMAHLTGSNYSHNKKVLDQTIRWAQENRKEEDEPLDMSDLTMSEQHRLLVGTKLIDIFVQTTGLVVVETHKLRTTGGTRSGRIKQELYLKATDETKTWINKRNAVLEFLTPVNLPTIIPPRDWAPGERGGYHFALRDKYEFVRGNSNAHDARIDAAEMPIVYEAVNRIQSTAWRINPNVLALVEEILENGRGVGNLSLSDVAREELPAKPTDIATNEEARKRWRKSARAVHERNHTRKIRALSVLKVLTAAKRVASEERIYFPCSLDFRGRVYPLTHYLNPQGDDLSKSLLTFADGKPLGEEGAVWLAIHGANCLDQTPEGEKVKTMTMQERASWIQRNTLRIVQVATDPFSDLWWTDADEPLQFFAFCVEWRGFYEAFLQGRGDSYVCSLPVSMDGSCNGLQHFSALLRDPIGGKAVNLTPEERPQDVYQSVTDRVAAMVQAEADAGGWLAQQWMKTGLIKRKLCKRPTMTFCYGSKRFGMAEQTLQFLQEDKGDWQRVRVLFTDSSGENQANEAAQWMAGMIWNA